MVKLQNLISRISVPPFQIEPLADVSQSRYPSGLQFYFIILSYITKDNSGGNGI